MNQSQEERIAWFVLHAQTNLMTRWEMSHRVPTLRGWRYVDKEEDVLRGVTLMPAARIRWYQELIQAEHQA